MNKALHALIYIFLVLTGAALWFELQLNAKRALLTDRNRLQEDYFVRIAGTIEQAEPSKDTEFEIKKDVSPVEAKLVDAPEYENVLEEYKAPLEQKNLETYSWEQKREQLRAIYVLDAEGKPVMDGNMPLKTGPGTEDELLSKLFESAKRQQSTLNTTRDELTNLRGKLEGIVDELNKLKPIARQDKVTIVERDEKIKKLEGDKKTLEDEIVKRKAEIEQLEADKVSLNDEITNVKADLDAEKDEHQKTKKVNEQLKKIIKELMSKPVEGKGGANAVTSVTAGDKGKIVEVDHENMFAIIELTQQAKMEIKGNSSDRPLPTLELGVKRKGFKGTAGEFVGRIKLRQEIKGRNYVICDILGSWEQDKLQKDDIVFAD